MVSSDHRSSKQGERTKKSFKEAFIELIHEKGFSHVTVTDIIRKADYNRSTFYLHYQDKFCLADELRREMFQQIKQTSISNYEEGKSIVTLSMGPSSFELTEFIYANQSFFNLYLLDDTLPSLLRDLPQAIYEVLKEQFHLYAINQDHDINHDAHKLYMAHGTAGLLVDWIEKQYPIPPAEMSQQLIDILESFTKTFTITRKS
ncbi:TetR/AcrR family transcriptional regulator [Geomicrobium sp. JCM 19055]|uniref:TetR/AcrR family transcriptional regulator n=1 Tax=Geomicrobium sp. JCM 19055 TaxID=1460649 RepID=UPI00045ECD37|nr:TetR/AcrR family transcriptional regulator [Geomicrobium sp. JCM 19055]GAK00098.1 transcriptional regulator, TetR family [Geomicrobium sp. JCM 19055]